MPTPISCSLRGLSVGLQPYYLTICKPYTDTMTVVDWINSITDFGEWAAGRKPVAKKADALRFGILGAAKIA